MGTTIHDESHIATVQFLTAKLHEHKTWTNEKKAVLSVLRKYLIHIDAIIVHKNSMHSLSKLGSYVYVSNLEGWFPDVFVKNGTAELRVLIAHRDKGGKNKAKQFAILTLNSHSSERDLEYFNKLLKHKDLVFYDLWFKNEMPDPLWEALRIQEAENGLLEFSREDEGIGVSWYDSDITGDEKLNQQLYLKLEDSAIELQDLGGLYPRLELNFLTDELIAVSIA